MTSDDRSDSIALARRVANFARERRATDVVVLDVRTLVDYADAFLVMTGQSTRQNLAIAEHIVKSMKAEQKYAISKSGLDSGSWICLDMGDLVVHVFDPETRARYDLELLWADAPRVDLGPAPTPIDVSGVPAVTDTPDEADADEVTAAGEAPKKPRRRRAVRRAAVEEADAENAPESERPTDEQLAAEAEALADADAEPVAEVEAPAPRRKKTAGSTAPKAATTGRGRKSAEAATPRWTPPPTAAEKWIPIKSVPSKKSLPPKKDAEAKARPPRPAATKTPTPRLTKGQQRSIAQSKKPSIRRPKKG